MKVLFVPMPEGGPAHLIPLLALNNKLIDTSIKTAFLLCEPYRELVKQLGVDVLDIPHRPFSDNGFRVEMRAYGEFAPDVVVDDACLTTGYATSLANIKRVAIQRTGMFSGDQPVNKNHRHSGFLGDMKEVPEVGFLGLPKHKTIADFFTAKTKIVPGIRRLEVLPPELQNDQSFHFAGPLLMDDLLIQQFGQLKSNHLSLDTFKSFDPLDAFFEKHRQRQLVYVTFGTVATPSAPIIEGLRYLLDLGVAVVSSIRIEDLSSEQREAYYFASYLPMHTVCAHVDLMIHPSGSGTYHYPILHHVPSITIGTQCFDREHVALRLAQAGVSIHLPAPTECDNFVELFREAIERYFEPTGAFIAKKKRQLSVLNEEIKQTSAAFDFEKVLSL